MAGGSKAGAKRSFSSQKQQTRLHYTPLPSSSPDEKVYSAAVQDRLANVRFEGSSPTQKGDRPPDHLPLPTPDPSSQAGHNEAIFTPPSDLPASPARASDVRGEQAESSVEEDELLPPSSKRRRTRQDQTRHDAPLTPARRSRRIQAASSPLRPRSSSPSSSTFSHGVATSQMPTKYASNDESEIGSPESSDDDALVLASRPVPRRRPAPAKSKFVADNGYRQARKPSEANMDDWLVDDDRVDYISSDSEATTKKSNPARRKQKKSRTPRQRSHQEQEELEADLQDLQDSEGEISARKSRTRGGPVTTARDRTREHFDLLRRRRAGEKVPRTRNSDEESGEDTGEDVNYIGAPTRQQSDGGSFHSSVDTEQEPANEVAQIVEEDEDEFVEDDEAEHADRRGRPHPDIPIELTHFAKQNPRELFPHIVEWMVKNKLSPAFDRHDELYNLAFRRVNDQVNGQAGSRLISSAWNAEFKWTILARPEISISTMPGSRDDHIRTCDACNKTNRPASYDIVLSGTPYSHKTLEAIDNSDDEDEYDDDVSRDAKGHELASQKRHFYLGSQCAANAQMGHKLTHWKYHLNEEVLAYLDEQDVLSVEAIVAREKLSKKKREREAEAVVDSMEAIGKIADLWRGFQNDLDDARLGMEDYQKKGGRSQGRIGTIKSTGTDGRIHEWRDDKYRQIVPVESDSD